VIRAWNTSKVGARLCVTLYRISGLGWRFVGIFMKVGGQSSSDGRLQTQTGPMKTEQ
jgi:hypothetical protein